LYTDETPTPSRYIRHQYGCEDLFEEVCSGLNPFDEQFRRASQARSQPQINLEVSIFYMLPHAHIKCYTFITEYLCMLIVSEFLTL
jgi:hypothetical protein